MLMTSCGVVLRQLLLVLEMFGLESCAGLEAVQMVSNLRALGVPVHLSTVPGTISALVGILLIPALGVFMDRWANSRASKAKILVLTSSLCLLGTGLVLGGNVCRLALDEEGMNTSPFSTSHHPSGITSATPTGDDDFADMPSDETFENGVQYMAKSFVKMSAAGDGFDNPGSAVLSLSNTSTDHYLGGAAYGFESINATEMKGIIFGNEGIENRYGDLDHDTWKDRERFEQSDTVENDSDTDFEAPILTRNNNFSILEINDENSNLENVTSSRRNSIVLHPLGINTVHEQEQLMENTDDVRNHRTKRGVHKKRKQHGKFHNDRAAKSFHDEKGSDDNDDEDEDDDDDDDDNSVPFFAIIAMVGYALIDCGFDSSNCFLKTFAIACVPPEQHAGVIVKCVLMSSLGGSFYCILGLIGVGDVIALAEVDPNAANTSVQASLCFTITLVCLIVTLVTGFCPPARGDPDTQAETVFLRPKERKPRSRTLSITRSINNRYVDSSLEHVISGRFGSVPKNSEASSHPPILPEHGLGHGAKMMAGAQRGGVRTYGSVKMSAEGDVSSFFDGREAKPCLVGSMDADASHDAVNTDTERLIDNGSDNSLQGFVRRQKKQIIINVSQFFLIGGLYAFEIYCTNFVSISIYRGDPEAEVGSVLYDQFLRGVEAGTAGVLVYYVSFTVFTFIVSLMLKRVGCVRLMWCSVMGQVAIGLVLAAFPSVWLYFVASVWMGLFRAVINTVPYILANQMSVEQNGAQSTGAAIAAVSAMLPCAFALCSALMGPLMHATGNAAAPIYYSAVSGALGLLFFAFLKP